jgi:hypothetical protein
MTTNNDRTMAGRYPYDARNPAPGVRVDSVPIVLKPTGLSSSQMRAWRNGESPINLKRGPLARTGPKSRAQKSGTKPGDSRSRAGMGVSKGELAHVKGWVVPQPPSPIAMPIPVVGDNGPAATLAQRCDRMVTKAKQALRKRTPEGFSRCWAIQRELQTLSHEHAAHLQHIMDSTPRCHWDMLASHVGAE